MPANPGTQADIGASHSTTEPLRLYIRKVVRPVHVPSQLLLFKNVQDIQFTKDSTGVIEISGLSDSVLVERFLDPSDSHPLRFSPASSSRYRSNSAVPDSVQRFIIPEDEVLSLRSGPSTIPMSRNIPSLPTPSTTTTPTHSIPPPAVPTPDTSLPQPTSDNESDANDSSAFTLIIPPYKL